MKHKLEPDRKISRHWKISCLLYAVTARRGGASRRIVPFTAPPSPPCALSYNMPYNSGGNPAPAAVISNVIGRGQPWRALARRPHARPRLVAALRGFFSLRSLAAEIGRPFPAARPLPRPQK